MKMIFNNEKERRHFEDIVETSTQNALNKNSKIIEDAAEKGVRRALLDITDRVCWIEDALWKIRLSPNWASALRLVLLTIVVGLFVAFSLL